MIDQNKILFEELKRFSKFFTKDIREIYEVISIQYLEDISEEYATKDCSNGLIYYSLCSSYSFKKEYTKSLYDTETSMYYCKSRYYVPEWCRWLNGDNICFLDIRNLNSLNLFCYCNNNPLISLDENGTWSWKKFWSCVGIAAIAAVAIAATVVSCGAAAAGAGALATMTAYSVGLGAIASTVSTVAVVGTYAVAGLAVAGIAAFAGAEIQEEITGQNYMSWLGGAYDSVKGAAYAVPFALPMLLLHQQIIVPLVAI